MGGATGTSTLRVSNTCFTANNNSKTATTGRINFTNIDPNDRFLGTVVRRGFFTCTVSACGLAALRTGTSSVELGPRGEAVAPPAAGKTLVTNNIFSPPSGYRPI